MNSNRTQFTIAIASAVCFGTIYVFLFLDFHLFRFGICAGNTLIEPWACGRAWISALGGYVGGGMAIIAALIAARYVKRQIRLSQTNNNIARIEFINASLSFLFQDERTIRQLVNGVSRERNLGNNNFTIGDRREVQGGLQVVDRLNDYLMENESEAIKFLSPPLWETRLVLRDRTVALVQSFIEMFEEHDGEFPVDDDNTWNSDRVEARFRDAILENIEAVESCAVEYQNGAAGYRDQLTNIRQTAWDINPI